MTEPMIGPTIGPTTPTDPEPTPVGVRAWLTPRRVWIAIVGASLVLFVVIGRDQWFVRDDWAFVLTRPTMREQLGVADWLFTAQDGHWMTPPLLVFAAIQGVVGIDVYWPYLAANMALHVAAVLLLHRLCTRAGVSRWTTVLVCSLMLVFGSGWENVVFAVQVTYNLSLVAFFAHLLLVDHDGPVGRRDAIGAVVGVVGVSSSAFGPFYAAAVFAVLAWRRRWTAAAVAVGPQALIYSWWLFTWGSDPAGESGDASATGAVRFARLAITATFNAMTWQILFAGAAVLGIAVVVFLTPLDRRTRSLVTVLAVLPLPVLLAIGWQRAAFGLESAASPRYLYMSAFTRSDRHLGDFDAIVRYDDLTGERAVWSAGPHGHVGEGVFAADPDGTAEDDGWVLVVVTNATTDASDLVVLDARDVAAGPVARVHLPQRVPFGFHGNWFPEVAA